MVMMPLGLAVICFAMISAQAAYGATQPLTTVADVHLRRYVGTWFEIARLPNRFERACASDVTAEYALRPDGRFDVVNRCLEADGAMRQARGIARRRAGLPASQYLWLLARRPRLDASRYDAAMARAREHGFDVERVTRTVQSGGAGGAGSR